MVATAGTGASGDLGRHGIGPSSHGGGVMRSCRWSTKRLHLRRDVARARIDDVDRCRRGLPIAEHALEPLAAEVVHAKIRGKKRDAQAGQRGGVEDIEVAHHQARGRRRPARSCRRSGGAAPHRWGSAPNSRQSCCFRSSGDRGRPRFLRYAGVATRNHRHAAEAPRDQRRVRERPRADAEVEALLDEVDRASGAEAARAAPRDSASGSRSEIGPRSATFGPVVTRRAPRGISCRLLTARSASSISPTMRAQ